MPSETTPLSPGEERLFRAWAKAQGVRDLDHPASRYDYRGYWKHVVSKGEKGTQIDPKDGARHFPDTFKQHGHPLFSAESQYSRGLSDGGRWLPGDVLVGPPAASHMRPAPGSVDLYRQPEVPNDDGTTSTVDSRSYNFDGVEVLLPSVTPDGRHLRTDAEIVNEYLTTGRHLGKFGTVAEANAAAETLHDDYARGRYRADARPRPSHARGR